MTAPTEAEMAIARRIAADRYDAGAGTIMPISREIRAGRYDDHDLVQVALAAIRETTEAAAKLADQQAQDFLSPEYATGQPLSSLQERFACRQIAKALRANHHLPKGPNNG